MYYHSNIATASNTYEQSTIALRSRSRSGEDDAGDAGTTCMHKQLRPVVSTVEAVDFRHDSDKTKNVRERERNVSTPQSVSTNKQKIYHTFLCATRMYFCVPLVYIYI